MRSQTDPFTVTYLGPFLADEVPHVAGFRQPVDSNDDSTDIHRSGDT